MAKKPETKFKERIKPLLDDLPASWWLKTQMLSCLGVPDYLGCVRGRFVALELKKDGKTEPTQLQLWVLAKIQCAGGWAQVVYPENWLLILTELKKMAAP